MSFIFIIVILTAIPAFADVSKLKISDVYKATYKNLSIKNGAFKLVDPMVTIEVKLQDTQTSINVVDIDSLDESYPVKTEKVLKGEMITAYKVAAWKDQWVITTLDFFSKGKHIKTIRAAGGQYPGVAKGGRWHELCTRADKFDEIRITQKVYGKVNILKDLDKYAITELSINDERLFNLITTAKGFGVLRTKEVKKDDIDYFWRLIEGKLTRYTDGKKFLPEFNMFSYIKKEGVPVKLTVKGVYSGILPNFNSIKQTYDVEYQIPEVKKGESNLLFLYDDAFSLKQLIILR